MTQLVPRSSSTLGDVVSRFRCSLVDGSGSTLIRHIPRLPEQNGKLSAVSTVVCAELERDTSSLLTGDGGLCTVNLIRPAAEHRSERRTA